MFQMIFNSYPVKLKIDYPKKLNRLTTFFRAILIIPILIVAGALMSAGGEATMKDADKDDVMVTGGGIIAGLFFATVLMVLFRKVYPRWWFDFALELHRFLTRINAYFLLLTDKYPSTTDEQTVHLDIKYPKTERDLARGMPLVKWLLALPHYVVLLFLSLGAVFATIFAWFAILFTGRYPKGLFNYVVGVLRWEMRVTGYAFLLVTDKYPPFSLK